MVERKARMETRRWKERIIQIVPLSSLFFESKPLPTGLKLSKEVIGINYAKLSPVRDPRILFYRSERMLYLWFLPADRKVSLIPIPENFLFYLGVKRQDGVYWIGGEKVVVIKERELLSSFQTDTNFDAHTLAQEYVLDKIEEIDRIQEKEILGQGIEALTPSDILQFIQIDLTPRELAITVLDRFTYPAIALMLLYAGVGYFQGQMLKRDLEHLRAEYQQLRRGNTPFKEKIRRHNREVEFLAAFASRELQLSDSVQILERIQGIVHPGEKAKLESVRVTGNLVDLRLVTREDPVKYLERLNALPGIADVVIANTYKRRSGEKLYTFRMRRVANESRQKGQP
jgi:cell division protein FtsB